MYDQLQFEPIHRPERSPFMTILAQMSRSWMFSCICPAHHLFLQLNVFQTFILIANYFTIWCDVCNHFYHTILKETFHVKLRNYLWDTERNGIIFDQMLNTRDFFCTIPINPLEYGLIFFLNFEFNERETYN